MANIADNLKRLLGTEGNNIQEVLENADSIGGGSIPYIEFVAVDETGESGAYRVSEVRGIQNITNYTGPCYIKFVASYYVPLSGATMLGSAVTNIQSSEPSSLYSILVCFPGGPITYIFNVSGPDDVTGGMVSSGSSINPGTLTPVSPSDDNQGGTA